MSNKKDFLQDYIFHYNIYTEEWNAFSRDDYNAYWNGNKHIELITGKNINHVVDLLHIRHGTMINK